MRVSFAADCLLKDEGQKHLALAATNEQSHVTILCGLIERLCGARGGAVYTKDDVSAADPCVVSGASGFDVDHAERGFANVEPLEQAGVNGGDANPVPLTAANIARSDLCDRNILRPRSMRRRELNDARLSAAQDADRDTFAWRFACDCPNKIVRIPDGLVVNRRDQIAQANARSSRRSLAVHGTDQRAERGPEREILRERGGDILHANAHPAALNTPKSQHLIDDKLRDPRGHREADP